MFTRLITVLPIVALAAVAAAVPNGLEARDEVCSTHNALDYCCTQELIVRDLFPSLPVGDSVTRFFVGTHCIHWGTWIRHSHWWNYLLP